MAGLAKQWYVDGGHLGGQAELLLAPEHLSHRTGPT
jgi:hypothetical protein